MTVKILIKRTVPPDKEKELMPLLKELRDRGAGQPGYVSGETLKNIEFPYEVLVISTWQTAEDWNRWAKSDERREIQDQIDYLLQAKTEYGTYDAA